MTEINITDRTDWNNAEQLDRTAADGRDSQGNLKNSLGIEYPDGEEKKYSSTKK